MRPADRHIIFSLTDIAEREGKVPFSFDDIVGTDAPAPSETVLLADKFTWSENL